MGADGEARDGQEIREARTVARGDDTRAGEVHVFAGQLGDIGVCGMIRARANHCGADVGDVGSCCPRRVEEHGAVVRTQVVGVKDIEEVQAAHVVGEQAGEGAHDVAKSWSRSLSLSSRMCSSMVCGFLLASSIGCGHMLSSKRTARA